LAETEAFSRGEWIASPLIVAALSVSLFFLIRTVVYDLQPVDPADPSFARVQGVVKSADAYNVTVAYDDGRRSVKLGSVGKTYPEVETRVLLEHWHGQYVSALDPVSEHRYRGTRWPGIVSGWVPWALFFDLLVLGTMLYAVVAELVRRRRVATT
jgi:hypothetical protein